MKEFKWNVVWNRPRVNELKRIVKKIDMVYESGFMFLVTHHAVEEFPCWYLLMLGIDPEGIPTKVKVGKVNQMTWTNNPLHTLGLIL